MEIPLFLYSNSKDFINFPKNKYFPETLLFAVIIDISSFFRYIRH